MKVTFKFNMLVNKNSKLSEKDIPSNLIEIPFYGTKLFSSESNMLDKTVYNKFLLLRNKALEKEYNIVIDSGYRSYSYQDALLKYYLNEQGDKAYKFCAIPGTSEHQTAFAIDVAIIKDNKYIEDINDENDEVKWLKNNAFKFGFILRYPKDKENVTGYIYEPWHYRYVGEELARYFYQNNKTLEEYYEEVEK